MPFTFSHAAAVIPVYRLLQQRTVLSALVIGSMAPDFHYFLPFDANRVDSHSLAGMIWFCLPVAMALYLIFHLLLKRPLIGLFPPTVAARLYGLIAGSPLLPQASGVTIVGSFLLGIATHLLWDAFTHYSYVTVFLLPVLSSHLFSIGSYHVYPYKILQHGSTVAGAALLWLWTMRWLKTGPALKPASELALPAHKRYAIIGMLLVLPPIAGLWLAQQAYSTSFGLMDVKDLVREMVIASICTFELLCFAYAVIWHLFLSVEK